MRRPLLFLAVLLLAAGSAAADQDATHPFTATAAARGVRFVTVDIPAGDIRIRNGAAGAIAVSGNVRRRYDGWRRSEETQRIVDDTSVEVIVRGDHATVRRRFGPAADTSRGRNWHSRFEVTIDLPPGVAVDLGTHFGEIDVDGAFAAIDADLTAGEVRVRTPKANVHALTASVMVGEVHTYLGDHSVHHEGVFPRTAHWTNAAGRSDVNVHTTFGEVSVTLTE